MMNYLNRLLSVMLTALFLLSCGDGSGSSSGGLQPIAFSSYAGDRLQIYLMNPDGSDQKNISNFSSSDYAPAWSPSGSQIAFTATSVAGDAPPVRNPNPPEKNAAIYVMEASGQNRQDLTQNLAFNDDPAWSPNGAEIAFASKTREGLIWSGASVLPGEISRWDLNGQPIGGGLTVGFPISAIASTGSQVWVGSSSATGEVNRFDRDGNFIGNFTTGSPIGAMVWVVDEIWIGSSATPGLVRQYNAQTGVLVGESQAGAPISSMVFDGNTIWTAGSTSPGTVTRFDQAGNVLTTFATGTGLAAMVLAGEEVWTGGGTSTGAVNRFDLEGELLDQFDSNAPVAAMVFTGAEVWTGGGSGIGLVTRFDLLGRFVGSFNAQAPVLAIAGSEEQVWIAANEAGGRTIKRYRFNGDFIDSLTAGGAVGALAFVPSDDFLYRIAVMNSDGSNPRSVFSDSHFVGQPDWSPDGSQIVFSSSVVISGPPEESLSQIFVMSADGQNLIKISQGGFPDDDPAWSPDGNQIAFVSERDGRQQIYLMNTDGSSPQNISNGLSDDWGPAWSPDGNQIVFSSLRDGNSQIYLMDADGLNQTNISNSSSSDAEPAWKP